MALFHACEIGALDGVIFTNPLGFHLSGVELFAQSFESQFALGALGFDYDSDLVLDPAGNVGQWTVPVAPGSTPS